jgi:predicted ribosomally synthesized peptide with SipW-like signal peptide
MNKRLIISLILIGVLAFGAGLGSYAWFTSTAASTGNAFTSGTLQLDINDGGDGAYTLDFGTIGNMAPGDVTDDVIIKIENSGSLDHGMFRRFKMSGSAGLANQLEVVTYKVEDWSTGGVLDLTTHSHWSTNRWDIDGDGYVSLKDLTDKPYDDGGGWAILGLKPGQNQTVTVGFKLREEAGNGVQGKTVNLGMEVIATQINAGAIQASMDGKGLITPYTTLANRLLDHVN